MVLFTLICCVLLTVFTGGKPLPSDDILNALFSRLMVSFRQIVDTLLIVCAYTTQHRIR